ncbi:hypothetical protein [Sinorhizobium meliloti]|uniref:hypothetical protein n=1 Tax=Rhizobium meliloti TaxID=382 RepID=UPI003F154249
MTDNDFLDSLLTPEEIARRITASSGVYISARTVWEKARRIGVAKKIGRSMLISIEDVPALLIEETRDGRRQRRSRIRTGADALAMLQRARKTRAPV